MLRKNNKKIAVKPLMQSVYLMTYDNIYKIGISDKPKKRLSTFKTANPKISLVCYSDLISFAPMVENKLHGLFKN